MKTARERAQQAIKAMRFYRFGGDTPAIVEHIFREYARDQRHACAVAAMNVGPNDAVAARAHAAAMNAPFPGEGQ